MTPRMLNQMTYEQRLDAIAEILEIVDNRCAAADGPVTKTRHEITDEEYRRIYKLAKRKALKSSRPEGE